jgi:hypothetical protein
MPNRQDNQIYDLWCQISSSAASRSDRAIYQNNSRSYEYSMSDRMALLFLHLFRKSL